MLIALAQVLVELVDLGPLFLVNQAEEVHLQKLPLQLVRLAFTQ